MIDPDQRLALALLRQTLGDARVLPVRWEWRTVPFGPCPRCQWPANTLGPDAQPWHAFCWGTDTAAPAFDQWARRKVDQGEWGKR